MPSMPVILIASSKLSPEAYDSAWRVGVALGSCGPTILRASEAEGFAAGLFDETGWSKRLVLSDAARTEFGRLVASAARPIDDVRGTAAYRRHVLGVIAGRALARVGLIT